MPARPPTPSTDAAGITRAGSQSTASNPKLNIVYFIGNLRSSRLFSQQGDCLTQSIESAACIVDTAKLVPKDRSLVLAEHGGDG
jgi:hypothetical protein